MTAAHLTEAILTLGPEPRMRDIFDLAKAHVDLPIAEIDTLLDHDEQLVRVGALSVMDKQARRKRTSPEQRAALHDLYLRRHDRIDTWDLVDLGAPHVIGGHLADKPRDVLYTLARSRNWYERRTAIVACLYFVRAGEVEDTFALAEILRDDAEHYVQLPVGSLLREAGKRDEARLRAFLDAYAPQLPRVTLRFAMEKLDAETRAHYRAA